MKILTPDELRQLTPRPIAGEPNRFRCEGIERLAGDPLQLRASVAIAGHLDRIATVLERMEQRELELAAEAAKARPVIGPGTLSFKDLAGR